MDQRTSQIVKPELLAPAGNLQKLKIAYANGADACYVGGKVFGLRKYADNFTDDELRRAVDLATASGRLIYVVLNGFAHDDDLAELGPHLDFLESIQPHGFIISDWGVAELAKQRTQVPIHASTQASVTNWRAAKAWVDFGATRVILAREVTIDECKRILAEIPTEIEIFVHGSMCASYSGKCVISNYSAGRDSNRGGCVQSCRHTYALHDESAVGAAPIETHIMNAKDLMGVRQIEAAIRAGIASLKIEGRMKSNLYVANAVSAYRRAIDYVAGCLNDQKSPEEAVLYAIEQQLQQVSNRTFSSGGLDHRPAGESIHYTFGGYEKSVEIQATVRLVVGDRVLIEPKIHLNPGVCLTVVNQQIPITITGIWDMNQMPTEVARAGGLAWVTVSGPVKPLDILVQS